MPPETKRRVPKAGYGRRHSEARARLRPLVLAGGVRCARCGKLIAPDEPWDLGHVDGDPTRYAGPEHRACNRATTGRAPWAPTEPEPEIPGLLPNDPRWDVPWLSDLRDVPENAVWPRLMTVPHPRAVGSLGENFCRFAEERSGRPMRWWQRLVANRLLEIDAEGRLVWEVAILSMARQLGKSWLFRELCWWRIHQGERFAEPQTVMHTAKDLSIAKEVQRDLRLWAKQHPADYKVTEVNGQEMIERLADGSRWLLRAKGAVYGYSASGALVDEGWKIKAEAVEEGLVPTMAEREQAQLWLVSTAHRMATPLMLSRRKAALQELESGEGDLLIEWSAPIGSDIADKDAWRSASPHWTPHRERLVGRQLQRLLTGEIEDPEEPDPIESFKSQWLNIWPRKRMEPQGMIQDLLPHGVWAELAIPDLWSQGSVFVGIEDDFGKGAAVAAAAALGDGRIEVDGWLRDDWDSAIDDLISLAEIRRIRELYVGASLLSRIPTDGVLPKARPAVGSNTKEGLALIRDLVASKSIVHDQATHELDVAVTAARVKESSTGLHLISRGPTHLVRALAWAVSAAHRPSKVPAIL